MYRGNNPTALQSQKMITVSLLELMDKKEFSKIKIREICDKAMVSRQTFYTLFDSKEEVVSLHLDALFAAYIERYMKCRKKFTTKELCDNTISYLAEQKELIRLMVKSNLDYVVKDRIEHYLSKLDHLLRLPRRENGDYAIAFLSGALMSVISLAVKNNELDDVGKLSGLIGNIMTGEYFSV